MFRKFRILAASILLLCLMGPQSALSTQTINVGIGDLLDSDQGRLAQRFKEIAGELSDGEIDVQLFPGGTLGTEQEMIQNVRSGVLDIAIVSTGTLASFVPHFAALHYPYLIESRDEAIRVTTGYLGGYWNDIGKSRGGFEILGWAHSGFRYLTNSRRPVRTLADLKGLKIRVPQDRITLAAFTAWGAKPVPMAWEETYTSLQQGVVDGQEAPYVPFLEVQKYIAQTHYQYKLSPMVIGTGTLAKLDEASRNILTRAGLEAQQYQQVNKIHEAENALQRARNMGIEICALEDEEIWKELAREKVWPQFYDSVGGKLVVDTILLNIGKL